MVALALALGLGCGTPAAGEDLGVADSSTQDGALDDMGAEDAPALDAPGLEDQGHDAGETCTCSGISTCCDGCAPRNPLVWCHASGSTYGRCSTLGTCNTGAPGAPVTCAADACHAVDESALPSCVLVPANNGGACNDGNATTFGDTCSAGTCAGTSCVSSPPCITRSWNGTSCVSTPETGDPCDDGNVTTHTDECQSNGTCAGTPCECTSGPCCDGCFFRGTDYVCEVRTVQTACGEGAGPSCGLRSVFSQLADVHCSGGTATCSGSEVNRAGTVTTACAAGNGCFQLNATPTGSACVECP